ncbi:MAG: 16S rRNA (adenine(1518)-N(6)/adenine(1519)-N(6))-dimethyltransferase RsmA [Candidatus Nomurabacteria bacterium]|nr:16S rRNA (adenine(1518)-N(6)/adenine(1519)-N(6))-dimethyltransferase RsmA [Candidatus Nomurabacteria bacterium]
MTHQAKKSMGQNFLKSKEALFKMCEASSLCGKDVVLEIGPGKGALTEKLLEKSKKVFAIEMDRDLVTILEERFKEEIKNKKLKIVEGDCLEFKPDIYLKNISYKIIANIPYNITGSIIRKFLSDVKNKPTLMTLLVQKEVAERIVARDGKESILSLSVKAYATPKYIMKVHKRFFSPEPKVDSAIISINNISNELFKEKSDEELFFRLIKTGFAHKRKVLRKNLEDIQIKEVRLPYINKIDEIFAKLNINPKARAEDIKFEKWIQISHLF